MSDNPKFDIYDIDISIKKDEILSVRIFDHSVFNLFNPKENLKEDSEQIILDEK